MKDDIMERKNKWINVLFAFVVLLGMMLFFVLLHPIPIMDEDDVIYTVLIRKPIPIPGSWNPSRVLPEVLATLCGQTAALLTRFGFGTFIHCQVFVTGTLLSLFITAYVCSFRSLLIHRIHLGEPAAIFLAILFLELHFLVYRVAPTGNLHMFHTYDECCVFFYTIPALLCSTIVMRFLAQKTDNPLKGKGLGKQTIWITVLYFAVFSNLYGSIILAAYAGIRLLCNFITERKKAGRELFWKQNGVLGGVLLLWILAAVLESTGGRASGMNTLSNHKASFPELISNTAGLFFRTVWNTGMMFKLIFFASLLLFIVLAMRSRQFAETRDSIGLLLYTCGLTIICSVFLILLSAIVNPEYLNRPEAIFVTMFTLILMIGICTAFLFKRLPKLSVFLPVFLLLVFSVSCSWERTYADSNPVNINGHAAVALENEIYESIIRAAEEGRGDVGVPVPKYNESGNWPHDGNIGAPIAQMFLKYGIIDHDIFVWIDPSEEINAKYGINP